MIRTARKRREMLESLGVDPCVVAWDSNFMWAGADSNNEENRYFNTTEVIQALIDKVLTLEKRLNDANT